MKKVCYLLIITLMAFGQACTPDTGQLFDKPASERMSEALEKYRQLLVSASNGWLVEYYPHSSRTYGGFNLFFQFNDKGEVTVRSDVDSPLLTVDQATSLYSLGEDMGPTLNFDTHNEVLNFFSDPALNVGGGAGLGLEGDYEFVFLSGDASGITLRGKKTKNIIRMTPLSGEGWEAYRDGAEDMREIIKAPAYSLTVSGKAVVIFKPLPDYNRFKITYQEEGNDEPVTVDMGYTLTPTGIRFYEPLTIDGVTMWEFTYDNASDHWKSEDGKAVIGFPSVEDFFVNSMTSLEWFLSSSRMGSDFLPGFNAMKSQLDSMGEQLAYAWIGASLQNYRASFSFASLEGSSLWFGSNLITVTKMADRDAQIQIVITNQYEVNGEWYAENVPLLKAFTNSLGGKYKVTTTDPPRNITTVTLTDPENADRWLTLTLDEVVFP